MGLLHCRQILYLLNYKGSSLLCLPPAEFPNPKTELMSPALQADSLLSEPTGKPKASRGNGIPAELFKILKDDAVKMLHSMLTQLNTRKTTQSKSGQKPKQTFLQRRHVDG